MILSPSADVKIFHAVKLVTVVCSWCPDKDAKTAAATSRGETVSHGLCSACAATLEAARIEAERIELGDQW